MVLITQLQSLAKILDCRHAGVFLIISAGEKQQLSAVYLWTFITMAKELSDNLQGCALQLQGRFKKRPFLNIFQWLECKVILNNSRKILEDVFGSTSDSCAGQED